MADDTLHLTQDASVQLGTASLRRLIACGDADAALLYLALQVEAPQAETLRALLRWDAQRFEAAQRTLGALGLIQVPAQRTVPPPPETALPDYSREDVAHTLENDRSFAAVLQEAERKMGRLSEPSVKKLLGLYDYLGLPADVILLLFNYCAERKAEQFGAEKPPTMRDVEKTGYAWARMELFTLEAADAYLRRERERRSHFGPYMEVLGLGKRAPVSSEEKYLGAWLDWGFPPETVAVAYDRTMLNCHEFKWAYCNGILRRWHEKGIHTAEQARAENGRARRSPAGASGAAGGDKNAWMDEFIK
ncbi:MAG: DnaD domain protein [Oscillospiraceae bacterium]|nr:DnaD domain protein [Oscillospiraceae bacterium]